MRQTDHTYFMGDIWDVHNLRLTYSMYTSNSRCMECSHFTVDVQGMSALQKMVRIGKNIGQNIVWCSLMWLMPLRSLSSCDYELKNLPRLILDPIHSNQVMGMDPVGSYHGTRNSRSNSINPTYPYQSHD